MTWLPRYTRLPADMRPAQAPEGPAAGHQPRLVFFQESLGAAVGLPPDAALFAGAAPAVGDGRPEPVALAYAGHQFGNLAMLGDGRAVLLGGRASPQGDATGVVDVQLKGSGRTPFSRGGDGRAGLGPMLREALFSEAMHALGVPTTRTLAVATTGRVADRRGLPPAWAGEGAVLTRVARSHLRVGSFVLAAHLGPEPLAGVLDEAVAAHDPDLAALEPAEKAAAFLARVIERQAALVAQWMSLGFVHGVLNTDNVAVSGETIDFGPCAFLDVFDPGAVFSSIDRGGRYAFGQQPAVTQWNLGRLAEALLPLMAPEPADAVPAAEDALARFAPAFESAHRARLRAKLGLGLSPGPPAEEPDDGALVEDLLTAMRAHRLDWTDTFRRLAEGDPPPELSTWSPRWTARLAREGDPQAAHQRMRRVNPATVPRNHHVAEALTRWVTDDDPHEFNHLLAACREPFQRDSTCSSPPEESARPLATFCGT